MILGPAPAPLTKLRGEHRAQFFLKGTSRKAMREAIQLAYEWMSLGERSRAHVPFKVEDHLAEPVESVRAQLLAPA